MKRMVTASNSREPRSDAARNHQTLVRAATAAVHREGPRVPMATIAADAGVGIGTLYRHFPTREDLLGYLTHASFEQVLANAEAAESNGATAAEALRQFIESAISQRNELVLPLHGGPRPASDEHPRRPRARPPDNPADHRPRAGRRHHHPGRNPARHRRIRIDARPAAATRPGLGRDLPPAPRHLPRGPGLWHLRRLTSAALKPVISNGPCPPAGVRRCRSRSTRSARAP